MLLNNGFGKLAKWLEQKTHEENQKVKQRQRNTHSYSCHLTRKIRKKRGRKLTYSIINESSVQFIAYHPFAEPNVFCQQNQIKIEIDSVFVFYSRLSFSPIVPLCPSFLRLCILYRTLSVFIHCFALLCVFSPIMYNHFRAALFIPSIFHSFAISRGYATTVFFSFQLGFVC